ncbi:TetR family transcriptional regulator [Kribbella orskensis]|uniref:TetR family transcriptional regulator n=1 Tax=Kribbella orskensis TaxID=2512216 RepID=A0ABY2BDI3_9ACTN|nr:MULTISPECIES: TetR/AcrR family transcriptional regulator [Kribbella]TCN35271.1 TetR family transcriptional regulator [Kribbella sp. VKM Ac-2500]TCO16693.1 TetR family transcriptional regulator [Kribbella orskensis]
MTEYAGQGDPGRTLALLWGKAAGPKRGPRQATSVEEIVDAAVRIADRHGLDGVTMRAVGQELGRTAMSLYTYVPGRGELLDLMYDSVHQDLGTIGPAPTKGRGRGASWRKAVTHWCTELRDLYLTHPWLLQISAARPVLGPHEQAALETLLAVLAESGLPLKERPAATSALFSVVQGAARQRIESANAQDPEWWRARAQALAEAAPDFAERFPHSVAIAARQATLGDRPWERAAEEAFTGAINLILEGITTRTT